MSVWYVLTYEEQVAIRAERYRASEARRGAARMRTLAFQSQSADATLYHTAPTTLAFNAASERFAKPGLYWTPMWTDEARAAFYRRTSRFT